MENNVRLPQAKPEYQCYIGNTVFHCPRVDKSEAMTVLFFIVPDPRSSNFHGRKGKISGEEDRFHLPPMGFLPSETRLEIIFDFDLFSCSDKIF